MAVFKVVQGYDGRLPVFHVMEEITSCNRCGDQKDVIVKSFDTYEEADTFCDNLIIEKRSTHKNNISPCGEEVP